MHLKPLLCLVAASVLVLGTPLAARADVNYDLIQAGFSGNPGQISVLVSRGADVNARDDYGYTALMWAAQEGHVLTSETLIEHGADVNARDKAGRTALLIATVKGHTEVVRSLLAHHADPTLKAKNGISALDYARIYRMTSIARMLDAAAETMHMAGQPRPHSSGKPNMGKSSSGTHMKTTPGTDVTPTPMAMSQTSSTGSLELSAQARDAIAKLHGHFMDHLGLRDPEAIVEKGFNQALEDKLDQVFLALDYGHTATMSRAKVTEARKAVNEAKQIANQPDPQDDEKCPPDPGVARRVARQPRLLLIESIAA